MNLRRKRLRLMRDTQWRGYARTAEGNPITLSQVRSVANLSVLGNSTQDGTPSPDNPVEVVGSGERTGNLFDISQITSKNGGYVDNNKIYIKNYSFTSGITPQKFLEMTGLQIGDTFTCSAQYTQMQDYSSGARYANFVPKKSGLTGLILFDYNSNKNNEFRISTIPSDFNNDNYYGLYFYGGNISTPIEGEIRAIWSNFAIYKGAYDAEIMPPYEPYGYKLAVQASGRNLLSSEWENGNIDVNTGMDTSSPIRIRTKGYIYCIPGKYYTIDISPYYVLGIRFYDANKIFLNSYSDTYQTNLKSFFVPEGTSYFRMIIQNVGSATAPESDLPYMLVEGSYTADTMLSYEPYKEPRTFNVYTPEPLHGVGDAHNTVLMDFDNKKAELIKRYKWFKIDQEQWLRAGDSYDGINTTDRYHNFTGLYSGKNSADDSKCNVLPKYNGVIWNTDEQGFTWNSAQLHLRVNNDVLGITTSDTAEERTSKFASYTQNNDIYVLAKLVNPTTTDITALQQWDTMTNLKGTWILTASGGTEPTLTAEYYSNERSIE